MVYEYFKCNSKDCDFTIGDNTIDKFFAQRGVDLSDEERAEALKNIASKKKGFLFTGFLSKGGKRYDAKVMLDTYFNEKRQKNMWRLSMNFNK
jgi:hypothetical protein